jgi:uncharacterized membrane protein YfcA
MTFVLAISGATIFLIFVIVMVAVLAYTAFSRRGGQRDISQHPVDSRNDVAPGAGRPSRMSSAESPEPSPGRGPDTQQQ